MAAEQFVVLAGAEEKALTTLADYREAGGFAALETARGMEPAAVVQLAPGAHPTEDELKAWVRARLAIFKTPVRIIFSADPLPRNANGKILKKQLGALFDEPVPARPASPLPIDA